MGINFSSAGTAEAVPTAAGAPAVEGPEAMTGAPEVEPAEAAPNRVILESDLAAALGGCGDAAPGELESCLGRELQSRGYSITPAAEAPAIEASTEATAPDAETEPAAEAVA